MKIAIIGTAGRKEDWQKLNRDAFGTMFLIVNKITRKLANNSPWTAVSGGAAWADHLAVFSFGLGYADKLILELPCSLTPEGKFMDTGERNFRTNPGGTANYYHQLFSEKTKINSFNQLRDAAKHPNCTINVRDGLFDRNSKVAETADACIALTFGDGPKLKDGGTMDTMSKFLKKGKGVSFHIDLHNMSVYSPAIVKLK